MSDDRHSEKRIQGLPHIETSAPAGIKPATLPSRIGTGLAYGLVVLAAVWFDSLITGIALGVMSGFAAAEFYAMERRESRLPNELFGVVASAAMPFAAALWGLQGLSAVATGLIAASLVWHTLFTRTRTADTAITVFGAAYTGFMLAYLVLIRSTFSAGREIAVLVVATVWITDVMAWFVGSLIGRHRLAPHISPKKSWEGFIAGLVGSVALWAVAGAGVFPYALDGLDLGRAIAIGASISLAAVIGDLAESRMKREAGVKDSGDALPGHGGFLDRLDSLILVCLVAYWVLWWCGIR